MKQRIAVVGAGPVGLLAALALARAGHEVRVFEKRAALSTASRASTFHPPTLDLLDRLGVLAAVAPLGKRIDTIDYYRSNTGRPELAARFRFDCLEGITAHPWRMHLEQSKLTPVLLHAVLAEPGVRVEFGAAVEGFTEHDDSLEVTVRRAHGSSHETFGWLVGADGANSAVRAAAGIAFEGEDYAKRILRIMTPLDLRTVIPGMAGIAYVYNDVDSISLLEMPQVWRIIIRLAPAIGDDEAQEPAFYLREIRRFLPLAHELPAPAIDIYRTSQRIAAVYRKGRVLLAGDAAHVTNTRGGMNMNCGLHDAWTLGEAFAAHSIEAGLDIWTSSRRAVATDKLIPRTDRSVEGGVTFLASIEASARKPERALLFVRDAAMIDIAPAYGPRKLT